MYPYYYKKDKLSTYKIYVLDISNIFNCNPSLNYLSNNMIINIIKIKNYNKNNLFNEIWKKLDNYTKYKYKLLENSKLTYETYNKIVYNIRTPKPKRIH